MLNLRYSLVTWVAMSSSHWQTGQEKEVWVGDRFGHCQDIMIITRGKSKSKKEKQTYILGY